MASRHRRALSITRESQEDTFVYRDRGGRKITKRVEIARIEQLAIPPAWQSVEISSSASSKVLARGIDEAGRVQTIYHPSFRKRQDRQKFDRMARFGRSLPRLRARVDRDLRRRGLGHNRVIACVVRLIDQQLFRVGSPQYAKQHRSYGVTTLLEKHLTTASGSTVIEFDFIGKSGKRHQRRVRDSRLARVIDQLVDLPGPEIFRFFDEDEIIHRVRSRHVNAYVKRHMGSDFSAKDFRTWGATVLVATALMQLSPESLSSVRARSVAVRSAVEIASERLGNTPATTRSSYVDPRVLDSVDNPSMLERLRVAKMRSARYLSVDEQRTLKLLKLIEVETNRKNRKKPAAKRAQNIAAHGGLVFAQKAKSA